jgi:hypothetical protein
MANLVAGNGITLTPGSGIVTAAATIVGFDILDYGGSGDGASDNTGPLEDAMAAADAAGGGIVTIPEGEFTIWSTVTLVAGVTVECSPGTTIRWFGGETGESMFTTGNAAPFVRGGFIGHGCTIDAFFGAGVLFDLHSIQGCTFGDFKWANTTGYEASYNSTVFKVTTDALTATGGFMGNFTRASAFNQFLPVAGEDSIEYVYDLVGMDGVGPVTLNTFHGIEAGNVYTCGIRIGKWVDNNLFAGVYRVALTQNGAKAMVVNSSVATELLWVNTTSAGSGYSSAPTVSFTGGGGSGAAGYAILSGGTVSGVLLTNAGTGYTTAPTVGFTGGGGSGAAATAILAGPTVDCDVYNNTFHHFAVDLSAASGCVGVELNKSHGTQIVMYQYDTGLDSQGGSIDNNGADSYLINRFAGGSATSIDQVGYGTILTYTGKTGASYMMRLTKPDTFAGFQVDNDGNGYFSGVVIADAGYYGAGSVKLLNTARATGWTAATGSATRTTFATTTVTTEQLAERVKALLDDLISHGLIGS